LSKTANFVKEQRVGCQKNSKVYTRWGRFYPEKQQTLSKKSILGCPKWHRFVKKVSLVAQKWHRFVKNSKLCQRAACWLSKNSLKNSKLGQVYPEKTANWGRFTLKNSKLGRFTLKNSKLLKTKAEGCWLSKTANF
jgi:hypothetical protein